MGCVQYCICDQNVVIVYLVNPVAVCLNSSPEKTLSTHRGYIINHTVISRLISVVHVDSVPMNPYQPLQFYTLS